MSQRSNKVLVVTRSHSQKASTSKNKKVEGGLNKIPSGSRLPRSSTTTRRDGEHNTTVIPRSDSSSEDELDVTVNPVIVVNNNIVNNNIINNNNDNEEINPNVVIMAQPVAHNPYLVRLRDITVVIPLFSGDSDQQATFREFQRSCEDVQKMLPPEAEPGLAQIVRTKLRGSALQTVRGENLATVKAILDQLKPMYAPLESSNILRGKLGQIYQKDSEDCPTFLNRVRALGYAIIDAMKSETDNADEAAITAEINRDILNAFKLGLKREISTQITDANDLTQAGLRAVKIEKQIKIQDQLRESDKIGCVICMDKTHITKDCTLLAIKVTLAETICQICKESGHEATTCRQQTVCQLCKKANHTADVCRSYEINITNSISQTMCQLCDQLGHTAKTCNL